MYMVILDGKFAGPFRLEEARECAVQWAAQHNKPVALFKLLQTHVIKPPINIPEPSPGAQIFADLVAKETAAAEESANRRDHDVYAHGYGVHCEGCELEPYPAKQVDSEDVANVG